MGKFVFMLYFLYFNLFNACCETNATLFFMSDTGLLLTQCFRVQYYD